MNATSPPWRVAVVNSAPSAELREVVSRDFLAANPEFIVAFLAGDDKGHASVISDNRDGHSDFPVAAAVAVFKTSWGWDESESFLIRVNDREMRVRAHSDGSEWVVTEDV
ncbi:MAG TPA: hypothetical protein VJ715_10650 [Pyrinomonadaceae bacterium]|nr:hypothetical protein [Pyrinomonadaceae bacterium]